MKTRPIIFDSESVRAILAGTKTQTRRVVKPQPPADAVEAAPNGYEGPEGPSWFWMKPGTVSPMFLPRGAAYWPNTLAGAKPISCPYGRPGDELWVRETFCSRFVDPPGPNGYYDGWWYAATDETPMAVDGDGGCRFRKNGEEASPWISPIRMPREASRLTLRVTDVRVERVQEITKEGAKAEAYPMPRLQRTAYEARQGKETVPDDERGDFRYFWDRSNAKRGFGWDVNPWVWVVSFEVLPDAS